MAAAGSRSGAAEARLKLGGAVEPRVEASARRAKLGPARTAEVASSFILAAAG